MHRLLMLSSTYQMASSSGRDRDEDPDPRWLSSFPRRRLEAEAIRDAVLAVSGGLDLSMGGKTLPLKNREFVFNHTSRDQTRYDSPRRSIYLPVIRNHLYDLFQQFDFPDPAVPSGQRASTVITPQALWMMNSDLVGQAAARFALRLLDARDLDDEGRIHEAYRLAFGRQATSQEISRDRKFLSGYASMEPVRPQAIRRDAWAALCQALLSSNEFLYLD